MFAIVQLGGKQYQVKEGDVLRIEKVLTEEDKKFSTDKVLLIADEKAVKIGTPLTKATVELQVLKTALDDKVRLFKMKAKKRYKRLRGHRQPYSDVKVLKITA